MQNGEAPTALEAVGEIAELLAKAYSRYIGIRPGGPAQAVLASTEALDNTGEPSPQGLTFTGQRGPGKESA
jgi:hypothetical protein